VFLIRKRSLVYAFLGWTAMALFGVWVVYVNGYRTNNPVLDGAGPLVVGVAAASVPLVAILVGRAIRAPGVVLDEDGIHYPLWPRKTIAWPEIAQLDLREAPFGNGKYVKVTRIGGLGRSVVLMNLVAPDFFVESLRRVWDANRGTRPPMPTED